MLLPRLERIPYALLPRLLHFALAAVAMLAGCVSSPRSTPPAATTILVSLDGFHPDYLSRFEPTTLNALAREGVWAAHLESIFPTKTFPNHYTLVTGRYADGHGIVSNTMRDSELGYFSLGTRSAVVDGRWWDDAEPIWVTLHKAGLRSAMYFWPGSEAEIHGIRPDDYKTFDSEVPGLTRVDWVMEALARPPSERPHLISLYFEDVDGAGHRTGPHGDETRRAVAAVDGYLGQLVERLVAQDLLDAVNLVITSDHGMASTSADSVVLLDDFISLDAVAVTDWDPILALEPDGMALDTVLARLERMPHVSFFKKEEIPARLHYQDHHRIPSIIGIAEVGWRISSRDYFQNNRARFDGGTHGYDPAHAAMHGIFIARGPAFKEGIIVDGFANIHVYALLCAVLGVAPAPNDGDLEAIRHVLR